MLAKDIMTTRVITVVEDTPVEEIVRILLRWRISAVPVVDTNEQLVGLVSEGDLVHRADSDDHDGYSWWLAGLLDPELQAQKYTKARGRLAKDVMSTPVISVDEKDSLAVVAALLEKHHIKRVPVLRGTKLTGIISRANILHGLAASPEPPPGITPPVKSSSHDDQTIRATILNRLHNDIGVSGAVNVIVSAGVVDLWAAPRPKPKDKRCGWLPKIPRGSPQ